MSIENFETIVKVLVLICVLVIYISSFSMNGMKKIKSVTMWLVTGGAIIDLMGKLGKGLLLPLIFILISLVVIREKKNKVNNENG